MAEWAILIMVFVVPAGAYAFNRQVYEYQSLLVWCIAGLIMTVGLLGYIFSKVQTASGPWADRYQIEDEP